MDFSFRVLFLWWGDLLSQLSLNFWNRGNRLMGLEAELRSCLTKDSCCFSHIFWSCNHWAWDFASEVLRTARYIDNFKPGVFSLTLLSRSGSLSLWNLDSISAARFLASDSDWSVSRTLGSFACLSFSHFEPIGIKAHSSDVCQTTVLLDRFISLVLLFADERTNNLWEEMTVFLEDWGG